MGAWGTAVFSDDFACDVKDQFRDFLAETDDTSEAIIKMKDLHAESLEDSDDGPVFWIALAATAWKLGRLDESTKQQALTVIESGADLQRWEDDPNLKKRRGKVLERLAQQLQTVQRQPVKIRKRWTAENDWHLGEVLGLKLSSDNWTLIHVTGHHVDRGGRLAVCQLLNWYGSSKPGEPEIVNSLDVVAAKSAMTSSEFILEEPRKKEDLKRIGRWGLFRTKPFHLASWFNKSQQELKGVRPMVLWSCLDELLPDKYKIDQTKL